jgi:glutamate racemase
MTIGICDYGIGGISLYQRIRAVSDVDIVYYSDTGFIPYGKVPEAELRLQVERVIQFLKEQGAEYIAVACNAASTVLPQRPDVIGMIESGLETVFSVAPKRIGVIGGIRTIESGVYKKPLEERGMEVIQQAAQILSIRIEAGDVNSTELRNDLKAIFEPLKSSEAVLLACTHYPAISHVIKDIVPGTTLLDPMDSLVNAICTNWKNLTGDAASRWITSGNIDTMRLAARNAFGVELPLIEHIVV